MSEKKELSYEQLIAMFTHIGEQLKTSNQNFIDIGKRFDEMSDRHDQQMASIARGFEAMGRDMSVVRDSIIRLNETATRQSETAQAHERRIFRLESEAPTAEIPKPGTPH